MMGSDDIQRDVLSGAVLTSISYNITLQLLIKATTFFQNSLVLRHVGQEVIGLVFVRLFLFKMSALTIAREPFRKASLSFDLLKSQRPANLNEKPTTTTNESLNGQTFTERKVVGDGIKSHLTTKSAMTRSETDSIPTNSPSPSVATQQFVNVLWLVVPLGIMSVVIFSYIWISCFTKPDDEVLSTQYDRAVLGFGLSAICEIVTEPLWIICQTLMFVRFKVLVEAAMHFVKTALVLFLVIRYPDLGLYSFVIAEIVSSLVMLLCYFVFVARISRGGSTCERSWKGGFQDFFPRYIQDEAAFNTQQFKLIISFVKNSSLKLILSEGERFVMTIFNVISLSEQGIHEVINNLGSIPARVIFHPTEESSYLFFAKAIGRGVPARCHDKNVIQITTTILSIILKSMILIGLVFFVFGYSYSELLLRIYGGKSLASGNGILLMRSFSFYVVVLAVNGITEAFATAAMSKNDVERYSHKMVLFSVIFLASAYILSTTIGSVGFIFANCVNLLARIVHNVRFTNKFYKGSPHRPLLSSLPSLPVTAALAFSFIVAFFSERMFCCVYGMWNIVIHVVIGSVCLLAVCVTISISERELVNYLKEKIFSKEKFE